MSMAVKTDKYKIEEAIKNMYREEANKLKTPESIKQRIDERLISANERKERIKMFKKKKLVLVAVAVLLFASITSYAGVKVSSTTGWGNAEPDSKVFSDCAKFAKKEGFKIHPVETFSNGYTYNGINVSTNQAYDSEGQPTGEQYKTLMLEYRNENQQITISVEDNGKGSEKPANTVEEKTMDGIKVYMTEYIHMMVPLDYELTEEEKQMIDEGRLGTGTDSLVTEVSSTTYRGIQWEMNGLLWYGLSEDTAGNATGDLELMAEELIATNK
ncbi:hypothetical protein EDD76_10223 [Kineothrix alysoides]|uniref:DUF4367 domain-containing protein n=2 Tax=Kineothrix alysoides TaxID=1469948 RepID=A0A4R1R4F4_9FIRM|nr:hypothetical protein EDD76_10223 [Kineothrix alysoides]